MTTAAATIAAADRKPLQAGLTVEVLAAGLLSLFAVDNLLLLHFWGVSLPITIGLIVVIVPAIALLCSKFKTNLPPTPLKTFAIALMIALGLFALGGEGRFFYSNSDWEVRDAVLHDLATNPWPFAYALQGTAYVLRAPVGMYLFPAMFGSHAEFVLLISNALRFALLLTLGWSLFGTARERFIALTVFLLFSGWDIVGTAINSALGQHLSWDHLEAWDHGYQYSSHVTMAFWVPQHAIAGWACALSFLLWRRGLVPIGLFAATVPLVAIWSPLAIMGAVPFAGFAAYEALLHRSITKFDVALAAVGLGIALPSLLYLQVGASDVGMHFLATRPLVWLMCVLLEVFPFVYPLLRENKPIVDRPVILIVLALLLLFPVVQIGQSADFQMRASVMPLALLSIGFAQWLYWVSKNRPRQFAPFIYSLVAIALGAATPLLEVKRAVINGPSPRPLCSLIGVWNKQDNMIVRNSTYLAPLSMLPPVLRRMPVTAGRSDPERCWDRSWVLPQGWPARSKI